VLKSPLNSVLPETYEKETYIQNPSLWLVLHFSVRATTVLKNSISTPILSPIIVPSYMFSKAQYDALNNSCASTYEFAAGGSIQHFSTYKDVPGIGDKYFFSQGTYPYDFFNNAYPLGVNEVQTVINAVKNDPAQVNLYAIARIWRAYTFHRITDLYGDIPYSDAARLYFFKIHS
jgi:hypothetical protein